MIMAKTIKRFITNNQYEMEGKEIILCNFDDKTTNKMADIVPKNIEKVDPDLDHLEDQSEQSQVRSEDESEECEDQDDKSEEEEKEIKSKKKNKKGMLVIQ